MSAVGQTGRTSARFRLDSFKREQYVRFAVPPTPQTVGVPRRTGTAGKWTFLGGLLAILLTATGCASTRPAEVDDWRYEAGRYSVSKPDVDYYSRWVIADIDKVVPLDDSNASKLINADGELIVNWPGYDEPVYHPVAYASYALDAIHAFDLTGDEEYLRRALGTAHALYAGATSVDENLWFEYPFDYAPREDPARTLPAPWWSAMAQGQAMSVFVRLYERTGDEQWKAAAERTFGTFTALRKAEGPWIVDIDDAGLLWLEEYAGRNEPLHVINGHIYAMFGLVDYYEMTKDELALRLFRGGAETLVRSFDHWRVPDGLSYYCAAEFCTDGAWQPGSYHRGVAHQLSTLAAITGDVQFSQMAALLLQDYAASGSTG